MRKMIMSFVVTLVVSLSANAAQQAATLQFSNLPQAARAPISAALGQDLASYHARVLKDGSIEAENASQKMVSGFSRRGVDVRHGDASLRFALQAYGYGSDLTAVEDTTPSVNQNRVEYRRGSLTEWYVNGPLGLEQGFNVERRPGISAGQPLTIALTMSGSFDTVNQDGQGLVLASHDPKQSLRYSGLVAHDADGKELTAWEELHGGRLLLRVDDTAARYPVVVDPWVQLAKLTADAPEEAAELGYAIAASGNTIAVGAPFDTINGTFPQGSVYVFVKPVSGWANMTETAQLTASDGGLGDVLGVSVAISGNTIVAGAAGQNEGSNQAQGAAYVFVEPQSGWVSMTETAKLTASDGATYDFFGASVAINGATIAVGADGATIGSNPYQGAVYVFAEPSGGWTSTSNFTAKLTTSDGASGDQLGYSIGLNSNTLVAGARSASLASNFMQGASYVFSEPNQGWQTTSSFTGKLSASDGAAGDWLGSAVSISNNNIVVVGAPFAKIGSHAEQGALYIFSEPKAGWNTETQNAKLISSVGQANDELGFDASIAPNGKTIVAGAPGVAAGMVYVFNEPAKGWVNNTQSGKMKASDGVRGTWLGFGVAAVGNTLFGGSPCTTVASDGARPPVIFGLNQCQGAIYVFSN
jgi:hypothetical protein